MLFYCVSFFYEKKFGCCCGKNVWVLNFKIDIFNMYFILVNYFF